jgi:hypothetical protein
MNKVKVGDMVLYRAAAWFTIGMVISEQGKYSSNVTYYDVEWFNWMGNNRNITTDSEYTILIFKARYAEFVKGL